MIASALALALAWPLATAPASVPTDSFPHPAHRRLFTACTSCHAGIVSGDSAATRPTAALCANCHDGRTARLVDWTPRPPRESNLRFDHRTHFARTGSTGVEPTCSTCHALADTSALMEIARARPERCLTCHEHQATAHLATDANCATCHRPLPTTRVAVERIAGFPKPPSHDVDWLRSHATPARLSSAQCAVCHAREYCAACHVNASRVAEIQALEPDPRVAQLALAMHVTYTAPPSHAEGDFIRGHGLASRSTSATCATCHTRESCLVCHGPQARVPVVATLPRRTRGGAPGVDLAAMRPPGHLPDFRANHRAAAAGGDAACSRCHAQAWCATCHDAASRPPFHVANFVMRHAAPSYTQENECVSCHQVQSFCVSCHRQTGVAAVRNLPAGRFHTNQPNWTFAHGGAARRSLESCVACHQQSFCLQCHSASSGWKVSPHGQGFDPDVASRNAAMCRICHVGGPPSR